MADPQTLTWLVDEVTGYAICAEATSPSRQKSFINRSGAISWRRTPWGVSHNGNVLSGREKKVLRNGLRRAYGRPVERMENIEPIGAAVVASVAKAHNVCPQRVLRHDERDPGLIRARKDAIQTLRDDYSLSLPKIALLLNYKDHSAVRYLLAE